MNHMDIWWDNTWQKYGENKVHVQAEDHTENTRQIVENMWSWKVIIFVQICLVIFMQIYSKGHYTMNIYCYSLQNMWEGRDTTTEKMAYIAMYVRTNVTKP